MFTTFDGNTITLDRPDGAPARKLLAGRAFLTNATPDQLGISGRVDPFDVASRLRDLRDRVAAQFVGRDELAEAMAVALAGGEHLFVYGPPGTAKSAVLRLFADGIGGRFWRIVLNPDTTREDLLGPLDPDALRRGEWRRRWAGFANADLAFLDEVWKASPQVANILLDGLEERVVVAGDEERSIPLLAAVAASNEVPDRKESQAAYDRFLIRLSVSYLRDPGDFRALLTAAAGTTVIVPTIEPDEIRLLAATVEAAALDPPKELIEALAELWREIGQDGRAVSDRRWRKTLKLAVAAAMLAGEAPEGRHLAVARWTAWTEPDEEREIRDLVLGLTDPVAGDVLDTEALLADLKAAAAGLAGLDLSGRAEIAGKARKLVTRADGLLHDPAANGYAPRLEAVRLEANVIVGRVLDMMG